MLIYVYLSDMFVLLIYTTLLLIIALFYESL